MITLTLPHEIDDKLETLLDVVGDAHRALLSWSSWRTWAQKISIRGSIRSLEVTHGKNGWHPHLHVAVLTSRPIQDDLLNEFVAYLSDAWERAITSAGGRKPQGSRGVRVSRLDHRHRSPSGLIGFAGELARSDMKTGRGQSRTPFELLDSHDDTDRSLWLEYVTATAGRRAIFRSTQKTCS